MEKSKIIICSDVHLCHINWYDCTAEKRLKDMAYNLNAFSESNNCEKVIFLGDYSLDFWEWGEGGSYVNNGVSNTERFVKEIASTLKTPYYMAPGNHEQYGYEKWREITGCERRDCLVSGGYLFIFCDNYAENLNPDYHSDGTYTLTDISYVKECLNKHPDFPVILCSHYFDLEKENHSFFEFIKNEKRISLLICGHTHTHEVIDLGKRADNVKLYIDGHYSYSPETTPLKDNMWGFNEILLTKDGIEISYIEPENTVVYKGETLKHNYRKQNQGFFFNRI